MVLGQLQQVERQSRQIVDQLNESRQLPLPVQWQPRADRQRSHPSGHAGSERRLQLFGRDRLDAHLLPAKMWITGLNALQTPLLHLHTQANVSFRGPRSTWIS